MAMPNATVIDNAIVVLEDTPMSVSLLTASGIGKEMKKIMKFGKRHQSERMRKKKDESDRFRGWILLVRVDESQLWLDDANITRDA
mmetsp:Transcript_33711/g.33979  ORF Transcript_33711/g.33979 Transcript_33711/m.33979 type:complete len:86 (-) Transcript_33711:757-1014(-)